MVDFCLTESETARFWGKVNKCTDSGCWEWTAAIYRGYGYFWVGSASRQGNRLAHRVAYDLAGGEIADGLQLDHLCRNRKCVNPAHLEPVTLKENVLRGVGLSAQNAAKTHCKRGHAFSEDNLTKWTDGRKVRLCKACAREKFHAKAAVKKQQGTALGVSPRGEV